MGRSIEQIAEQLEIGLKGQLPIINGVQLGELDLEGLAEYENLVNPPSEEAGFPVLTKACNPQKFVYRKNRVHGRRRLTRLPERHSRNYAAVTGQEVPAFYRKPIIPAYILKAPAIIPVEETEVDTNVPVRKDRPLISNRQKRQLPEGIGLGINGRFLVRELLDPRVVKQVMALKGRNK